MPKRRKEVQPAGRGLAAYPQQAILAKRNFRLNTEKVAVSLFGAAIVQGDKEWYEITIKDLCHFANLADSRLTRIDLCIKELQEQEVEWGVLHDNFGAGDFFERGRWLAEVRYLGPKVIQYKFSSLIKEQLLRCLDNVDVDLEVLAQLTKISQIRVYMATLVFASEGQTGLKPLQWWFDLLNAKDRHQREPRKFFSEEIRPALKLLEELTPFRFELTVEGRPMSHAKLSITSVAPRTNKPAPAPLELSAEEMCVKTFASEFGIYRGQIRSLITHFGLDNVSRGWDDLVQAKQMYEAGDLKLKKKNFGAYAAAMLSNIAEGADDLFSDRNMKNNRVPVPPPSRADESKSAKFALNWFKNQPEEKREHLLTQAQEHFRKTLSHIEDAWKPLTLQTFNPDEPSYAQSVFCEWLVKHESKFVRGGFLQAIADVEG